MRNFEVCVPEFNAGVFEANYDKFITDCYVDYFDNAIFYMTAPQNIYDEIGTLGQEGIEILVFENA